jgi:glutathione S-transferase
MRYELYYWPAIPGRGEFVRLTLEDAAADYVEVGRGEEADGLGPAAILAYLSGKRITQTPFAPPFLKAGDLVISHVANILQFLGPRLNLAPGDDAGRYWAHGLQLTVTDFVAEIHDVHHPVGVSLYYEDQKPEARRRAALFREQRLPTFLGYFEQVLARNPHGPDHAVGAAHSYVDLSLFQVMTGLRHAFPNAMKINEPDVPRLVSLAARVAQRPNVSAYLRSERRLPFNNSGIFRHYGELDLEE